MPNSLFNNFNKPKVPKELNSEQLRLWEQYSKQQQEKDPTWLKMAKTGFEGSMGAVSSLFGKDFPNHPISNFDRGNALGQLAQAGLPFAAYGSKLLKGKVFHGTQRIFDKFNPDVNDASDVLGWMTHFAEDPKYASEQYAGGGSKGLKHISLGPEYGEVLPNELKTYGATHDKPSNIHPRVIPAQINAKNVLDLVNPNMTDLSAALAPMDYYKRKSFINTFKEARRNPIEARGRLNQNHFGDIAKIPLNEIPAKRLADRLQLTPEEFDKTQFDAIRYNDDKHKSWAVPSHTEINTPWGTPLNQTPKQLKVIKTNESKGGTLTVNKPQSIIDKYGEGSVTISPKTTYAKPGEVSEHVMKFNAKYSPEQIDSLYYNNAINAAEKNWLYNHNLIGK